jgi:2-polyprenyl-3-methyl-5-hydroxy-6-metoxy-1,4-benzoquinol methylase
MKCKLCEKKSDRVLLDVTGSEDTYLKLLGLDDQANFKGYLECPDCEIAFRSSYLSREKKHDLYDIFRDESFRKESLSEYFQRVISYPPEKSENHEKLFWLSGHLADCGRHLDIGGGVGVFSYAFMKRFQLWTSIVIEPTPGIDKIASEYGVEVHSGYVDAELVRDQNFKKSFDLVTLNHVLEHVDNPVDLLILCKELLSPNGMMYIETPSIKDIGFLSKDHDRFMSQHEVIYSERGLRKLMVNAGLTVISSETFLSKRCRYNVRVLVK